MKKKYFILVLIIFFFTCSSSSEWFFIEDSKLIGVEYIKASWSGYTNSHWLMTFESGTTVRNWDGGYCMGKIYEIYCNKKGRFKAVLRESE